MKTSRVIAWCVLLSVTAAGTTPASAGPFPVQPGILPSSVKAWASSVVSYEPGNGVMPGSFSNPLNAVGPAGGSGGHVVSLGDGGALTLSFDTPLFNGEGADLAVYENALIVGGNVFAELAFVDVSSNGNDWARFPSSSLTPSLTGSFGTIDPTNIHNLAGIHAFGLGTPFDLAELESTPAVLNGDVDLFGIRFVRLTDVVGDGSRFDAFGRPIYDPYPSMVTSGFDADGVGALNVVPEPATAALWMIGACCVLFHRRGRRRNASPRFVEKSLREEVVS